MENKIFHGDILKILPELKEEAKSKNISFDLVIADPPASCDSDWHIEDKELYKDESSHTLWNEWCKTWINLSLEMLSDQGEIYIANPEYMMKDLINFYSENSHYTSRYITWNTGLGTAKILVVRKNESKYKSFRNRLDIRALYATSEKVDLYRRSNYSRCSISMSEKPVAWARTLIQDWNRINPYNAKNILVPFSGTGTECISAKSMQANYTSIEYVEEMVLESKRRIESFPYQEAEKSLKNLKRVKELNDLPL